MKNRLTVFGMIVLNKSKFTGGKYSPVRAGGNGVLASLAASRYVNVD